MIPWTPANEKAAATTIMKMIPRAVSGATSIMKAAPKALSGATTLMKAAPKALGAAESIAPRMRPLGAAIPNLNLASRTITGGGEATAFVGGSDVLKLMKTNPMGGEGFKLLPESFQRLAGKLPRYDMSIRPAMSQFAEQIPLRNMVPGMPQMTSIGRHFNNTMLRQPLAEGVRSSHKDIRNWMRSNNVIPLRKGLEGGAGYTSSTTGRMVPARAGIARVPGKPWGGIIPRSQYLLMDDIKPGNFRTNYQGVATPFDVMAAQVPELQALKNVPQLRAAFLRRMGLYGGLGAAGAGGIAAYDRLNR